MAVRLLMITFIVNICIGCNYVQIDSFQIPIGVCVGYINGYQYKYSCEDSKVYRTTWYNPSTPNTAICDGQSTSKEEYTDNDGYECGESSDCRQVIIKTHSCNNNTDSDDVILYQEAWVIDECVDNMNKVICTDTNVKKILYTKDKCDRNEVILQDIDAGCNSNNFIDFIDEYGTANIVIQCKANDIMCIHLIIFIVSFMICLVI